MEIKGKRRLLKAVLMVSHYRGKKEKIFIARGSKISARCTVIGYGTNINGRILVKGAGFVTLGRYCAIGHNVTIISSNHSYKKINLNLKLDGRLGLPKGIDSSRLGVQVGHNVWIGDQVIILPGVTIGNGAVIGAGSVVTRDIPSYAIVAGNPARIIRKRFSDGVIHEIEATQWWQVPETKMKHILIEAEK